MKIFGGVQEVTWLDGSYLGGTGSHLARWKLAVEWGWIFKRHNCREEGLNCLPEEGKTQ